MIQQLARKKGIKNAFGLQRALGVSPTVATKLWNGNFAMIGLSTLDRLCELLDCYVGDLLKYEPSGLSPQGQSSNDEAMTDAALQISSGLNRVGGLEFSDPVDLD